MEFGDDDDENVFGNEWLESMKSEEFEITSIFTLNEIQHEPTITPTTSKSSSQNNQLISQISKNNSINEPMVSECSSSNQNIDFERIMRDEIVQSFRRRDKDESESLSISSLEDFDTDKNGSLEINDETNCGLNNQLIETHDSINDDEERKNGSGLSSSESDENEYGADEIDSLLEQGLPEDYRQKAKPKFSVKELFVLEEKGKNSLEALPDGWIEIRHSSGIPVYLERKSRVCTLAKPYSLGPSSVRKHLIPLSAIPCLSYKRALEKEKNDAEGVEENNIPNNSISHNNSNSSINCNNLDNSINLDNCNEPPPKKSKINPEESGLKNKSLAEGAFSSSNFVPLPPAKVETAEETNTLFTIEPLELRAYCQKLFKFKTIKCKRFKNWNAKRKHCKIQKRLKVQRPTLPDGVKLIKFPIKPLGGNDGGRGGGSRREYVLNPKGKSSVCILHEYVQHALRQQPVYEFRELEHASAPYSATVVINELQYGTGFGSSKKVAKAAAAANTLQVLIPQLQSSHHTTTPNSTPINFTDCFDQIELGDPRIATLCQNISEPTPYGLLLTCIQRNYGKSSETKLEFEMVSTLGNQRIKFKMTFKDYVVEIVAPNKKEGKQVASQNMLAKIHPHIKNFGAFILLYGNDSIKSCKEKKQDQQEVTELQSKASLNSPNFAILSKLREEMLKLHSNNENMSNNANFCPNADLLPPDVRPSPNSIQKIEKGVQVGPPWVDFEHCEEINSPEHSPESENIFENIKIEPLENILNLC